MGARSGQGLALSPRSELALRVPDEMRQRGRTLLRDAGCIGETVVIHPGSGRLGKCWPARCFRELAARLRDCATGSEPPHDVCFLLGPAELESWPDADVQQLADEFRALRSPSPDDLAAVLAAAWVFVGNDAGPTHLAALLGAPTVAIFGPTPANVWRPLGPLVELLSGDPALHAEDWGINPARVADHVRSLR